MHLFLKDAAGRRIECVAIAVGQHRMRLAARGWSDVLEIAHSNGRWVTEEGQAWEIESLVTDGQVSGDFFDDCFVGVSAA